MSLVDLVYTCKAEDDLDSVFDYIAEDSVLNALDYKEDKPYRVPLRKRWNEKDRLDKAAEYLING